MSQQRQTVSPEGEWVERAHDGLAMLGSAAERDERDRVVSLGRQVLALQAYAGELAAAIQRKEGDLVIAHTALGNMTERARIAETWAGILASEVERKEADLVAAHTALALTAGGGGARLHENAAAAGTAETLSEPDRQGAT
jgi:hypothetical protein